jgi:hypothetical protein
MEVARAGEWWEYKLVPIFGMFYATALLAGVPLHSLAWTAATLLAAIVPGAAYVGILNDLTDRHEDASAGKANRLAGRGPVTIAVLLALPAAVGLAFAWSWRNDPLLLVPYLGAWTAFTLYSVPPLRLKARGLAGVLADSSGAHLFPTLVAVGLVLRAAGAEPSAAWLVPVAVWALAYGLRGILWHQLLDSEADRAAAVSTFVQRSPRERVLMLARRIVFPAELAAMAAILWQVPSWLPLAALVLYAMLVKRKMRVFRVELVIVEPKARYVIALHEYYDFFLPVALLLACAWRWPADFLALPLHFLLFPGRLIQTAGDLWKLRHF